MTPAQPQAVRTGCLHCIDGRRLFASDGRAILVGTPEEGFRLLCRLPLHVAGATSSMRLLSRLLRQHVYHIVPFRDRLVVMGFGLIWCVERATGALLADPVPLVGGRPLALCVTPHGLYYGEYRDNPERSAIRVLFSEDGARWSVARELTGIRHVHGLYLDPFDGSVWMTTGDDDAESAIWRSDDRLMTLRDVCRGSQQARAITLLFTQHHVFFGSDTPLEQNYIYRLQRGSGHVSRLAAVEGSVFHGAQVGEWLLFSTAVEPSAANRSRDAVLYASRDGENWRVLARHRKDRWGMRYFQYGQLVLPAGDNQTGRYWYSTFAATKDHGMFTGRLDD